ncbi:MAG: hypothetical protein ACYTGV_02275 [Planctomycetota bacterium]|jgi:hypothetical protein
MRPLLPLVGLVLLLPACRSTPDRIRVQKVEGRDGAWVLPVDEGEITLSTEGTEATLSYAKRTFVIYGMTRFKGSLSAETVVLYSELREFRFTPEAVLVRSGSESEVKKMENFPEGGRATYDGAWTMKGP